MARDSSGSVHCDWTVTFLSFEWKYPCYYQNFCYAGKVINSRVVALIFYSYSFCLLVFLQGDLVEYYYTWKKTPSALSSRPHRRRRHNVLRRKALPRSTKSIVSEFGKHSWRKRALWRLCRVDDNYFRQMKMICNGEVRRAFLSFFSSNNEPSPDATEKREITRVISRAASHAISRVIVRIEV